MHDTTGSPPATRVLKSALLIVACLAAMTTLGCKSLDVANTESARSAVETGTVQATMTSDATGGASSVVWPDKVGQFSASFKGPVWYPSQLPKGMKVDSADVVEFGTGTGLVCDIVFYDGKRMIGFTQGSPQTRDYQIVSAGEVPWGPKAADVIHQDPEDSTSPRMIVLVDDDNFLELTGDVSFEELKAVAAGMVPVK